MPNRDISKADFEELQLFANLLNGKSLAAPISNDHLVERLKYHGITLLAAEQNTLPPTLAPIIAKHKAMMVANDTLKQIELAALFKALQTAKINAVLVKGSALAYSIYPKPWLRPRSDNDIIVAPSDRFKADEICTTLGYQKLFAIQGDYVSYQSSYGKALVGGSTINIDLHWHINNRQMFSELLPISELIDQAQHVSHFGKRSLDTPIMIPCREDSILIACIHRAGHHNKEERLVWLYDIHLLATQLNEDGWQQLIRKAKFMRVAAITLEALRLCHCLFGTQIINGSLQKLEDAATNNEPSSIFLNRELSERHYFWADLNSMPTWRSKLGFLIESTFPPPQYVRQQMNTSWASWGYVKRLYRGIKRVL